MRTRSKMLLAGLTAAVVLATAVGTASANRLSSSEQNFQIRWAPLNFIAGGTTTSCNVTLAGSFVARTVNKSGRIGAITGGTVNTCNAGASATILPTFPWNVTWGSFSGTLPSIASITLRLEEAAFRVDPAGILPACLARTDDSEPGVGISVLSGGQARTLSADPTRSIDLEDESFACTIGGDAEFSGTGDVIPDLTITLI